MCLFHLSKTDKFQPLFSFFSLFFSSCYREKINYFIKGEFLDPKLNEHDINDENVDKRDGEDWNLLGQSSHSRNM